MLIPDIRNNNQPLFSPFFFFFSPLVDLKGLLTFACHYTTQQIEQIIDKVLIQSTLSAILRRIREGATLWSFQCQLACDATFSPFIFPEIAYYRIKLCICLF